MLFKFVEAISSLFNTVTNRPGQITILKDKKEIYYDTKESVRISLSDIIMLDTEAERTAMLAPLPNKIYLVIATGKFYRNNGTDWKVVGGTDLTAATSSALGGIKSGGDVTVAADGTTTIHLTRVPKLVRSEFQLAATVANQLDFTITSPPAAYTSATEIYYDVFIGSVKLDASLFTITNKTALKLTEGLDIGRTVTVIAWYQTYPLV